MNSTGGGKRGRALGRARSGGGDALDAAVGPGRGLHGGLEIKSLTSGDSSP